MQNRLLRLTFFPLTLKTHTFIYLPIYVVRHYVAPFISHYSYVSTHLYILTLCSTIKLTLGTEGIYPHFWGIKSIYLIDSMSFIPQHLLRLFFSSISFKMFFGAACMAKTRKKSGATAQIGLNFSKLLELLHNYFRFFLSP